MIGHLLKIVWNRRRTNGLILMELLVSFLGLCAVLTPVCDSLINWNKPLGFDYENVWQLDLSAPSVRFGEAPSDDVWETLEQLRILLRDLEQVEAYSPLTVNVPFTTSLYASIAYYDGRPEHIVYAPVLPEMMEVLRLELVAGRWLEPGDEALNWTPVVITSEFARAAFGSEDPIGQPLQFREANGEIEERSEEAEQRRVVGIVSAYRNRGELQRGSFTMFFPAPWGPGNEFAYDHLLRVRPGVPVEFEEELLLAVHGIAPEWSANITPLSRARRALLRDSLLPMLIMGIVAVFFIVMVGLGLVGVLWQGVTRRTEELGIRRAMGATGRQVRGQILGELLTLTSIAVAIGLLLYLQLPLLAINPGTPLHVYLLALTLALAVIFSFVTICGLYPSWLATKVRPAEALQHE